MGFKNFVNTNKIELFTGFGISAIALGFIWGCKNATKVNKVLEDHNETREILKKKAEKGIDVKTDTYKLYGYTAARFAGLFAFPTALLAGGVLSCVYATKVSMDESVKLAEQNIALALAAVGSEDRFQKYRDRVIDKWGEEVDQQLMCPTEEATVEEEVEDETGKKKKVKKKTQVVLEPDGDLAPNVFYITRSNPNWMENDESMKFWFSAIQDDMDGNLNRRRADGRPTWITVNNVRERMAVDPRKDLQFWGIIKDNFHEDDGARILIDTFKTNLRSADGGIEPAWKVTVVGAHNLMEEIW